MSLTHIYVLLRKMETFMWVSGTIPLRMISKGKRSLAEQISPPSAGVFRCCLARGSHRACLLSSVFEDRNLVVFVKLSLDEDIASMIYLGLEFQYGSAIWHQSLINI